MVLTSGSEIAPSLIPLGSHLRQANAHVIDDTGSHTPRGIPAPADRITANDNTLRVSAFNSM